MPFNKWKTLETWRPQASRSLQTSRERCNYAGAKPTRRRSPISARPKDRPIRNRSAFPVKSTNLRIQSRLLLVFSGVITLVLVARMIAVNRSFQRGPGDYLDQVEHQRLDTTAITLANAYGEAGDGSFVRFNGPLWTNLLDQALGRSGRLGAIPPPGPSSQQALPAPFRPGAPPLPDGRHGKQPSDVPAAA